MFLIICWLQVFTNRLRTVAMDKHVSTTPGCTCHAPLKLLSLLSDLDVFGPVAVVVVVARSLIARRRVPIYTNTPRKGHRGGYKNS